MVSAIIVAGGRGIRMNAAVRKQYLPLACRPILGHTLLAFDRCGEIDQILLVLPGEDLDFCRQSVLPPLKLRKKIHLVAGGKERQESVYNGIAFLGEMGQNDAESLVLVHDAVRPFVRGELIRACISGAQEFGACIPAIPVSDTLKRADSAGVIEKTVPREGIWMVQTPQAFRYDLIRRAHEHALRNGVMATDDAFLVEALGAKVVLLGGSRFNIKITRPDDLLLAEAIYRCESEV